MWKLHLEGKLAKKHCLEVLDVGMMGCLIICRVAEHLNLPLIIYVSL